MLFLFGFTSAHGEKLVIAGTGDSQSILRKLATLFQAQNPGSTIDIPDSIGSGGGIKQLLNNKIELCRTARPLKKKEKDHGLTEILFAKSPVVFVTKPGVEVSNVSTPQVLDIFTGKISNWKALGGPDHKIYLVEREAGDSSRKILEQNLPGFKNIQSVGKIYYTTPETAAAIGQNDYTFGYLPLSVALAHQLHVFSLDNVAAASENEKSGNYPLVTPFYLVRSERLSPLGQRFIEFVFSPDAQEFMLKNGLHPVPSP